MVKEVVVVEEGILAMILLLATEVILLGVLSSVAVFETRTFIEVV